MAEIKTLIEASKWDDARSLIASSPPSSLLGKELLLACAINGAPLDIVDELAKKGVSVNELNQFNDSALTLAVWHTQSPEFIAKLIDLGANVDNKNTNGNCPITLCAEAKVDLEVVNLLLRAGAKVNATNNYGDNCITLAVWNKASLGLIKQFVRAGADVNHGNENENNALVLAGEINIDPSIAKFLIDSGADPKQPNKWGDTGLTLCAWKNSSARLAQVFLNAGADPNQRNVNGNSVISLACEANADPELVRTLIKGGADVNAVNNWGDSALTLACWKNASVPLVVELLKAGANVHQKNSNGNTPLSLAREAKADPKLVDLIKQAEQGNIDFAAFDAIHILTDLFDKTTIRPEDRKRYMDRFQEENFMDRESLETLDKETLKELNVKLGDANQLLKALHGGGLKASSAASQWGLSTATTTNNNNEENLNQGESLSSLPALPGGCLHYFFASHNWAGGNHERVGRFVDEFHRQGKSVWFDANRLTGNIESQITKGVDQSAVFVVFVTKTYVQKVIAGAESDQTDWCHYEFAYAGARKPKRMLAVVMDRDMLAVENWEGPVCARLGSKIYFDYSTDDKLELCVAALGKEIERLMRS